MKKSIGMSSCRAASLEAPRYSVVRLGAYMVAMVWPLRSTLLLLVLR